MRSAIVVLLVVATGCSSDEPAASSSDSSCRLGTRSCPCADYNTCFDPQGGPHLVCEAGYCVAETCAQGHQGCACFSNGTCLEADGVQLVCEAGTCATPPPAEPEPGVDDPPIVGSLGVDVPGARACDAVLVLTHPGEVALGFSPGVIGRVVREHPRVAVSFIRDADADFEGDPITVEVARPPVAIASAVTVERIICYGRDGADLPAASLQINTNQNNSNQSNGDGRARGEAGGRTE